MKSSSGLWIVLLLLLSHAYAQAPADSIRVPKALYLKISRMLGELEEIERQGPPPPVDTTGAKTLSREEFERVFHKVNRSLEKLQFYRHRDYLEVTRSLRDLNRLMYPDSAFPICSFYLPPSGNCLIVPRSYLERSQKELEVLQSIYNASTEDSTLIYSNVRFPVAYQDLWGRTYFELAADIKFLNAQRDTLYTLHIKKLKGRIDFKVSFFKIRFKALYLLTLTREGFALGIGSLNYRKFDFNLLAGTRLVGLGMGYNITRNFGPIAGVGLKYEGGYTPFAGIFFSFN